MKEIMNVNLVYNDFSEFEKLNVPVLNKIYLDGANKTSIPYINFNETYYKILNDKIISFRIIAISIIDVKNYTRVSYLVQMPNETRWITEFITNDSIIVSSKENAFRYMMGEENCRIKFKYSPLMYILKENNIPSHQCYSSLLCSWKWSETQKKPIPCESFISYLLITKDNIHVGVSLNKFNEKTFPSIEECLKSKLDGFEIHEFEEEPIEINVKIYPNTPKIHVLKFVED